MLNPDPNSREKTETPYPGVTKNLSDLYFEPLTNHPHISETYQTNSTKVMVASNQYRVHPELSGSADQRALSSRGVERLRLRRKRSTRPTPWPTCLILSCQEQCILSPTFIVLNRGGGRWNEELVDVWSPKSTYIRVCYGLS